MDEAQSHSKLMKVKPQITSGSENSALGDAENSDVSFGHRSTGLYNFSGLILIRNNRLSGGLKFRS